MRRKNCEFDNFLGASNDAPYLLNEFDEVIDFVNKVFGEVENYKTFNYPNDIEVAISRKENEIVVGAKQDGKQIFGQGWYFEPAE